MEYREEFVLWLLLESSEDFNQEIDEKGEISFYNTPNDIYYSLRELYQWWINTYTHG